MVFSSVLVLFAGAPAGRLSPVLRTAQPRSDIASGTCFPATSRPAAGRTITTIPRSGRRYDPRSRPDRRVGADVHREGARPASPGPGLRGRSDRRVVRTAGTRTAGDPN